MSRTLCEELLNLLHDVCVKQIFGITGDALNPFVDAIRRDQRFEWITVRHEEAGAFAASAQAKLTGQLAVCCGTVGPGGLHLINGLYDARREYAPVLAITGQVEEAEIGNDYHQAVDLVSVFQEVCVYNEAVRSPAQFQRLAQQAIQAALDLGGPAHLTIPVDIIGRKLPDAGEKRRIFRMVKELTPTEDALTSAVEALDDARKVTILAGAGCADATTELLQVAEILKAPVTHTLRGTDLIDYDHPYRVGGVGHLGTRQGIEALDGCDALLMVGTDFPYRAFLPQGIEIVQIDIRRQNIGRRCAVTHPLVGDARATLEALAERLTPKSDDKFLQSIQKSRAAWDEKMDRHAALDRSVDMIHPQAIVRKAAELADDDAIFVADVGTVTVWSARQLRLRGDQRLIGCFNHGSLGAGLPAAMGAQSLDRDRQVVAFCGDGGFGMLLADFITAVRYDLPVVIIVFNNQKFAFVELEMQAAGYPRFATDLTNPHFANFAADCGGLGERIEAPHEIVPALKRAFASRKAYLIDAAVNPDELVMPPKIEASEAVGFAMGKIKELWIEHGPG